MVNQFKFLTCRQPVYLIFQVTDSCNLNCRHCFNYQECSTAADELSLHEIEKITRQMGHVKYLTLAGGEPMLRDDLAEIAELFYRNNDLHLLNLVTNGWYTDKTVEFVKVVLEKCPGLHISTGISVDGPERVHDSIRGRTGSYAKALDTIRKLKNLTEEHTDAEKRLTVAACGTYNNANKDSLVDLALYFKQNLKVPYFAGLIRGDSVRDNALLDIDIDHYMAVLDEINYTAYSDLAQNYPFKHVRIAVEQKVSEMIYASKKRNRMTVACKAGKKGFVLKPDGDVLLCEVLNTVLGNVRTEGYSPGALLKKPLSRQLLKKIKTEKCHCTWECFQRLNVVFSPVLYPEIAMKSLQNYFASL